MALNTNKVLKKYYSIKEVSEMLEIPESTLRYWEKEFKEISPKKNAKGVRHYTTDDRADKEGQLPGQGKVAYH